MSFRNFSMGIWLDGIDSRVGRNREDLEDVPEFDFLDEKTKEERKNARKKGQFKQKAKSRFKINSKFADI